MDNNGTVSEAAEHDVHAIAQLADELDASVEKFFDEALITDFQETPLQTFWPLVVLAISVAEVFSVFTFQNPAGNEPWSIRLDHAAGDLGFDPLGLKPTDAAALKEMQSKELNNGRLAMIGIAGMVGQELVTGSKLF